MTAGGVPPWARPVLEALQRIGGFMSLSPRDYWDELGQSCRAALAADAGTPEGERVEGWTGKPGPCPNCGAIRNERDAHFCSSTRSAPAPLAEPDAAAPGPEGPVAFGDAELDRLISEYGRAHARAMELMSWPNDTPQCRAAIHAHVERRVAEAVKEERLMQRGMFAAQRAWDMNHPAPGDASGETADNFEVALAGYVEAALDCAAHDSNQPYERLRGRRELARQQVMRIYRAAAGEVVGTADVIVHYEDGDEYLPDIVPHPDCCNGRTESYTVDLVLRRGKEGVCE